MANVKLKNITGVSTTYAGVNNIELQDDNGNTVTYKSSLNMQNKTVNMAGTNVSVTPDGGYDGLGRVDILPTPTDTLNVITNGQFSPGTGRAFGRVTVNVPPPALETGRTVTPTTSQQTVTPSSGYYGMSDVTVESVQTETKSIIENGTYNATPGKYISSVTVNVPTSGAVATDFSVEVGNTLSSFYFNTRHSRTALDNMLSQLNYDLTASAGSLTVPAKCLTTLSSYGMYAYDLSAITSGCYLIATAPQSNLGYVLSHPEAVIYITTDLSLYGTTLTAGWQMATFDLPVSMTIGYINDTFATIKNTYFAKSAEAFGNWSNNNAMLYEFAPADGEWKMTSAEHASLFNYNSLFVSGVGFLWLDGTPIPGGSVINIPITHIVYVGNSGNMTTTLTLGQVDDSKNITIYGTVTISDDGNGNADIAVTYAEFGGQDITAYMPMLDKRLCLFKK